MNEANTFVLAVDLGGTNLRGAVVDETGQTHFRFKQRTPVSNDPQPIVHALAAAARECDQQLGRSKTTFSAICIAVPGSVNVAEGSIGQAPNIPCLDGFHLGQAVSDQLSRPVILENDANAAAVGEMWRGAARDRRTIVCVTLGTGVGGGIVLEGKVWRGVNGSAAEIGHMCVDPFSDAVCGCGGRGCLEAFSSATAVVRMAHGALPKYPDSILHSRGDFTSEDVYRAGKAGDKLALEVFQRMGDYLGVGLINLITILNPELIVIVGGLVDAWELFANAMNQRVAERDFPLPALRLPIVRGQCGDDAGLLGAARLGFDYLDRCSG